MCVVTPSSFNAFDKLGSLAYSRFSKPTRHKRARHSLISIKKKGTNELGCCRYLPNSPSIEGLLPNVQSFPNLCGLGTMTSADFC